MSDGIGMAEALLGMDGFRVLDVIEHADELVIAIETIATTAWCAGCGVRAEAHDRMPIEIRDLPCFGRPSRLVWRKRRWRCLEHACDTKTWTEHSLDFDAQCIMTRRAGMEAWRQVGELARPVPGRQRLSPVDNGRARRTASRHRQAHRGLNGNARRLDARLQAWQP